MQCSDHFLAAIRQLDVIYPSLQTGGYEPTLLQLAKNAACVRNRGVYAFGDQCCIGVLYLLHS